MNKLLLFLSIFLIGLSVNAQKSFYKGIAKNSMSVDFQTNAVIESKTEINPVVMGDFSSKKRLVTKTIKDTISITGNKKTYAHPHHAFSTNRTMKLKLYKNGNDTEFLSANQRYDNTQPLKLNGFGVSLTAYHDNTPVLALVTLRSKKTKQLDSIVPVELSINIAKSSSGATTSATRWFKPTTPISISDTFMIEVLPKVETDSVGVTASGAYYGSTRAVAKIDGTTLTVNKDVSNDTTYSGWATDKNGYFKGGFLSWNSTLNNFFITGTNVLPGTYITSQTGAYTYTVNKSQTVAETNISQNLKVYNTYNGLLGVKAVTGGKPSLDYFLAYNDGNGKSIESDWLMYPDVEYTVSSDPKANDVCKDADGSVSVTFDAKNRNVLENPTLNKLAFFQKYLGLDKTKNYFYSTVQNGKGSTKFVGMIDFKSTSLTIDTKLDSLNKVDTLFMIDYILPYGFSKNAAAVTFGHTFPVSSKINLTTTSNNATFGKADGKASVTVTGGYSPHTYLWSNSQTTTEVNVPKGDYSVNVTDANGCKAIAKVNVGEFPQGGIMKTSTDTSRFFVFKRSYASPATSSTVLQPYYYPNTADATKDSIELTTCYQIIPNLNKSKVTYKGITMQLVSLNKSQGYANVDVKVYDENGSTLAKSTQKVLYNASYGVYHFMFDKPVTSTENVMVTVEPQTPNDSLRVPTSGAYRNSSITCNITGNKLTLVSPAPTTPANIGTGFWTGQEITGTGIPAGTKITGFTAATSTTPSTYTISSTLNTPASNLVVTGVNNKFDALKFQGGLMYFKFPVVAGTKNPDFTKEPKQQPDYIHYLNVSTTSTADYKPFDAHIMMYPIVEYTYNTNPIVDNKCLGANKVVNVNYTATTDSYSSLVKNPVLNQMAFWTSLMGWNKKTGYYYSRAYTKSGSFKDTLDNSNQAFAYKYASSSDASNDTLIVLDYLLPYGLMKSASMVVNTSTFLLSSKMNATTSSDKATPGQADGKARVFATGGYSPYTYLWNNNQTTSEVSVPKGDYSVNVTDANGCKINANVNVSESYLAPNTSTTYITSCNSYFWNGITYTKSGNYIFNTKAVKGNDSIATLILTINYATSSTISKVACGSFEWNGKTYNMSGKYEFLTKNVNGCDSTAILYLTINKPSTSSITIKECGSYTWNGKTYTQSGKYDLVLKAANGCDSIVTLNLTILYPTTSTTVYNATGSYTWNGVNYTQSGLYTYKTKNAVGCDSVATLLLTINAPGSSTTIITSCDSYVWNNTSYNQTGTYTFKTKNSKGVDSIATLLLTINNSIKTSLTKTACDSYTWNGKTYTQSGKYDFVSKTIKGCDSTATLFLTINTPKSTVLSESTCGSFTWNGKTYNQSGKYYFTSKSVNGCDSIVTLNLTILTPSTSTTLFTANGSYLWNGVNYTQSGIYTFKTKNKNGCDSVATLLLTINAPGTSTTIINACESYKWNGSSYNQTGTYSFKTKNGQGNDSIATLLLTINKPTISVVNETACGSYLWNGKTYTQSGKYEFISKNSKGCDSIVTLFLTVNQKSISTISDKACGDYTWNNKVYTKSGKYEFITKNARGCDSIVTLDLTINPMPSLGVDKTNSTLISSQSNASYQWYNCDSMKVVLPNSTDQKYVPNYKGNYAVKINLNGCIDTSECVMFDNQSTTGLANVNQSAFSIYPNPNNGIFSVSGLTTGTYKIFDVLGTEVYSFRIQTNEIVTLDLSHLAKGVYHFATEDAQKLNGKVVITD